MITATEETIIACPPSQTSLEGSPLVGRTPCAPSSSLTDPTIQMEDSLITSELNAESANIPESRRENCAPAAPVLNTENCTLNTPPENSQPALLTSNLPSLQPCKDRSTPTSTLRRSHVLLTALEQLLPRFVVLPKHAAETLALWIVHTYCFQFRDVSTYIGIESPVKRCGKTTLLSVLGKLVHRPVVASNISPSAFFRVIAEIQPTLLIDEADTFLQGNDELRGIFNAGYHKPNAYVIRVRPEGGVTGGRKAKSDDNGFLEPALPSGRGEGESTSSIDAQSSTLARYSCWCPKVIAAIGHLPETLADRCIVMRMQRKRGDEACERLRNLDSAPLREQCARFASEHQQAIAVAKPELPDALNDRAADIWEPLFAIADIVGGDWPQKARTAAVALTSGVQETSPTSTLVFDICLVFVICQAERLFTHQLLEHLNSRRFAGRPWTEMLKGKLAGERWLAQQMRPFGITSKLLRIGERVAKGYEFSELKEVLGRYVPASEIENWREETLAKAQAVN